MTGLEKELFKKYQTEPKRIRVEAETDLYELAEEYNSKIYYDEILDDYYIEVFKISAEKVLGLISCLVTRFRSIQIGDEGSYFWFMTYYGGFVKHGETLLEALYSLLILLATTYLSQEPKEFQRIKNILEAQA